MWERIGQYLFEGFCGDARNADAGAVTNTASCTARHSLHEEYFANSGSDTEASILHNEGNKGRVGFSGQSKKVKMVTERSDKSQRESQPARESSGTAEGSLTVSPAETTRGALLAPLQLVLHQHVAVAISRAK